MTDFLPEIHQATLPGGMKLLGVEYDRVPWLSLTFMAKRGAETDPLDKPGVADWAAELLTLGTARRTQLQLAEDIESRGAALNARSGWDATLVNLEGLSEDFSELMATLAEVVQTPGFPEDEFSLLAERRRAELVHQQDDPREMANIRYLRLFFGDSPYGHAVPGDLRSLDNIGVADLQGILPPGVHPGHRHPGGGGHGGLCPGPGGGGPALGQLDRRRPGQPAVRCGACDVWAPRGSISWTGPT